MPVEFDYMALEKPPSMSNPTSSTIKKREYTYQIDSQRHGACFIKKEEK